MHMVKKRKLIVGVVIVVLLLGVSAFYVETKESQTTTTKNLGETNDAAALRRALEALFQSTSQAIVKKEYKTFSLNVPTGLSGYEFQQAITNPDNRNAMLSEFDLTHKNFIKVEEKGGFAGYYYWKEEPSGGLGQPSVIVVGMTLCKKTGSRWVFTGKTYETSFTKGTSYSEDTAKIATELSGDNFALPE